MDNIKGHIITNSFLNTKKYTEHYEWLKASTSKYSAGLEVLENADILCSYSSSWEEKLSSAIDGDSFILYWDKDIRLGRQLEALCRQRGILFFNSIETVAVCDDKSLTYQKLWEWNQGKEESLRIPLVPTITAPMTYSNIGYTDLNFLDKITEEFSFPIVVKECFGSFGMQVYLAENRRQLEEIVLKLGGTPHIYQKFIKESSGRDVRLQIVGGKVAAAMYRYSSNGDFRANVTTGAHTKPYKPSDSECMLAIKTAGILGLDFGSVDLLFPDNNGRAGIVCEVNSNAHFKSISDCTGVNVADKIIDYIISQVRLNRSSI